MSVKWLYFSCGFKVTLLVCVLGLSLFLFRTLWRDVCMFLESGMSVKSSVKGLMSLYIFM